MSTWEQDQQWEAEWWGRCGNTFCEETKQITYAHRMGLVNVPQGEFWPVYDLAGRSVLDIGGGPVSMLLRCINAGPLVTTDPCEYPAWTTARYEHCGIASYRIAGEDLTPSSTLLDHYDEVWIYNVLQHTQDPQRILANARKLGDLVRLFEWVDIPACPGHPQELKAQKLATWLGSAGKVEYMNENGCHGSAFYGAFPSKLARGGVISTPSLVEGERGPE